MNILGKKCFPLSIRIQLIALVLLAVLPALFIILINGIELKNTKVRETYERSLSAVRSLALQQEQIADSTRQILKTLALVPQVRSADPTASTKLFQDLVSQNPAYYYISIASPKGRLIASSLPLKHFSIADRKHFQDAIKYKEFSAGEYVVSRDINLPTLYFSYPILDRAGRVRAVLNAALNLDVYSRFITSNIDISGFASYVTGIADYKGVRFYRYPDQDSAVTGGGVVVSKASMKNFESPNEEGIYEGVGSDGTYRLYAYKKLRLHSNSPVYGYVFVGAGRDAILAEAESILNRNLILLALTLLLALAAAWGIGNLSIVNRLKKLKDAAHRLADGDLQAKAGLPSGNDEISDLAQSFDNMSAALERKEDESQQTAKAIRRSESRYRQLIDQAMDGIFVVDNNGDYQLVNKKFCEMLGYTEDELLKLNVIDTYPDELRDVGRQRIQRVAAGESMRFERPMKRKNGSVFQVELSVAKLDEERQQGIIRDITERKRAHDELKRYSEEISDLYHHAPCGYHSLTADGTFMRINGTQLNWLGYTQDELIGKKKFSDLMTPESREAFNRNYSIFKEQGWIKDVEYQLIRKDGTIMPVLLNATAIKDRAGNFVMSRASLYDHTERKQAEEARKGLEERLNRAEKMESLGMLAGGVAHDLNNALGILIGYSELIDVEMDESNPIKPHIKYVRQGGERAAAIVQDLLTLARRGVQTREIVNLNTIITDAVKSPEFERILSFHPGVRIKTQLDADLLNIKGSSVHLSKTLMNLISNAAEAIKAGGLLTVGTCNEYLDRPIHGYDAVREGDYVVLTVSDTGEGISVSDMKRIFEPFYTKKIMGRSGTGLGLAVVWGTVKDHDGYINVESEEGKGTIFTLYFPITRDDIPAERKAISVSEYIGNGETILIVDDVEGQRELAGRMLKKLNYEVVKVSSGEEAVQYLGKSKADLVVLDMIMDPGMDGLDTYKKILEIDPRQKAIIVSGFAETERVRHAQELGAGAYIKKPYVQERLGLAVRRELDK